MNVKYPEFRVETECGRNFIWSAIDQESLLRELEWKGYRPILIEPYTEYQAELHTMDEQRKLNHEHEELIA